MADREDNVYMAKLAEQAERYDGKLCELCICSTVNMTTIIRSWKAMIWGNANIFFSPAVYHLIMVDLDFHIFAP